MRFVKLEGIGNDFVCVDCFQQPAPPDPSRLAVAVCRRRFGIGADGLILMLPADGADARMQIFNADGSEAEMCGNGIRCVAKYLYERGIVSQERMRILTGRGVLEITVRPDRLGRVDRVRVEMGTPVFEPVEIPTTLPGTPPLNVPLSVAEQPFRVHVVSMGNPHCVVFVDEPVEEVAVERYGPLLERAAVFPKRTNVEFVQVCSEERLKVRVWERGCGETLACGTGACAVAVVAQLTGRAGRQVQVELPGGRLELEWNGAGPVYMTGPAREVYEGEFDPETLLLRA